MRNRLLFAGSAAVVVIAGLSAAFAAGSPLDQVTLAPVPVAKLNVPCTSQSAFAVASGSALDVCGSAADALYPSSLAAAAPIAVLDGTNNSGALNLKLTDDLAFDLGGSSLGNPTVADLTPDSGSMSEEATRPLAQATLAGVSWNVTPWASLSVIAAQSTANDPFDKQSLNALARSQQAVGAGASARLGDNWVTTVSYDQGTSQLNLRSGSLLGGDDDLLHSHTLGISIAKRGLFGNNDSLDIGIARKLQSYTADIDFSGDDGLGSNPLARGNVLGVPETDFEVRYVTTFLDGALALQANAGYQTNVAGQNDKNALTVLSRAKFNF